MRYKNVKAMVVPHSPFLLALLGRVNEKEQTVYLEGVTSAAVSCLLMFKGHKSSHAGDGSHGVHLHRRHHCHRQVRERGAAGSEHPPVPGRRPVSCPRPTWSSSQRDSHKDT